MKNKNSSMIMMSPLLAVLLTACWASTGPDDETDTSEESQGEPGFEVCTTPVCFADFPCRSDSVCRDATTLLACRDIPCEQTCGTSCCSGASCGSGGTETCPEGTTCHQLFDGCSGSTSAPWGGSEARCLAPGSVEEDGQTWVEPENYCGTCS